MVIRIWIKTPHLQAVDQGIDSQIETEQKTGRRYIETRDPFSPFLNIHPGRVESITVRFDDARILTPGLTELADGGRIIIEHETHDVSTSDCSFARAYHSEVYISCVSFASLMDTLKEFKQIPAVAPSYNGSYLSDNED